MRCIGSLAGDQRTGLQFRSYRSQPSERESIIVSDRKLTQQTPILFLFFERTAPMMLLLMLLMAMNGGEDGL